LSVPFGTIGYFHRPDSEKTLMSSRADLCIVLGRDTRSRKLVVYKLPDPIGDTTPGFVTRDRLIHEVHSLPGYAQRHLEDLMKGSEVGSFDLLLGDKLVALNGLEDQDPQTDTATAGDGHPPPSILLNSDQAPGMDSHLANSLDSSSHQRLVTSEGRSAPTTVLPSGARTTAQLTPTRPEDWGLPARPSEDAEEGQVEPRRTSDSTLNSLVSVRPRVLVRLQRLR